MKTFLRALMLAALARLGRRRRSSESDADSVTCTALLTVGPVANIHMYDQDDVGPTANTYGCLKSTCGGVTGSVVPE